MKFTFLFDLLLVVVSLVLVFTEGGLVDHDISFNPPEDGGGTSVTLENKLELVSLNIEGGLALADDGVLGITLNSEFPGDIVGGEGGLNLDVDLAVNILDVHGGRGVADDLPLGPSDSLGGEDGVSVLGLCLVQLPGTNELRGKSSHVDLFFLSTKREKDMATLPPQFI
eukprot:CAMPEP_0201515160 /NCGR_PEP_ID=MMETSP0161_2-20130828/6807_1 /ASSEMBLY_ACC=CAM_ASM_000251 /TAXON_ID=180227 /ORGANISM="Neoparamoeba aestuarina, Strain SoJaBio B1-5/56/2" /LENGTH=168 /DNA_ID=CAMNT_0047911917 /DNA_START=33 /DNA_END=536 /DNA_ORIENTATION=-